MVISAAAAVGAASAWLLDRKQRRVTEEYQRNEERYRELLLALPGFYVGNLKTERREAFLNQVNLCWLYCSDEVIKKAYAFLD